MAEETAEERAQRRLDELLQELRVMLPGVEILFAFLLTVPFSERFDKLAGHSKALFIVTLGAAAASIALFIAPTAMHRLQGRGKDKEQLVRTSSVLSVSGMGFLVVAITSGLFIVVDLIYGLALAIPLSVFFGFVFVMLWYVFPLARRRRVPEE